MKKLGRGGGVILVFDSKLLPLTWGITIVEKKGVLRIEQIWQIEGTAVVLSDHLVPASEFRKLVFVKQMLLAFLFK